MNNATLKQLSYFFYLMEDQGIVRNAKDFVRFEEIEKVKIFELDKVRIGDYIEKLKSDRKWMEMITNKILGVD